MNRTVKAMINDAFSIVKNDSAFKFSGRGLDKSKLGLQEKVSIIRMYEKLKGTKLLGEVNLDVG